jgi:carbonic anhydrase
MNSRVVELLAGNAEHADQYQSAFDDLQNAQYPEVVTVCCSDSRVLQDHMWGNDRPGRIFTCGNIGNRVVQMTDSGPVASGDVLYPIEHTGTETVVVVGHTGCGAVTATYDELTTGLDEPAGIAYSIGLLEPFLEAGLDALPADVDRQTAIDRLIEYNVDRQVQFLRESDDIPDTVTVLGVVYDFQEVYSENRGEIQVINVDGEIAVETLQREYPEIESRIERLWEY